MTERQIDLPEMRREAAYWAAATNTATGPMLAKMLEGAADEIERLMDRNDKLASRVLAQKAENERLQRENTRARNAETHAIEQATAFQAESEQRFEALQDCQARAILVNHDNAMMRAENERLQDELKRTKAVSESRKNKKEVAVTARDDHRRGLEYWRERAMGSEVVLVQIGEVCDNNAAASCNQAMALTFVRGIVREALNDAEQEPRR